jgi:hypothetical protein
MFEGQIDVDALEKCLNMLEGYLFVHNFSNRERITFALLKVAPHVKNWWEKFGEGNYREDFEMFEVEPTYHFFMDVIKEQYNPVENYDDWYMRWTKLRKERDQTMYEFKNTFHTLCTIGPFIFWNSLIFGENHHILTKI